MSYHEIAWIFEPGTIYGTVVCHAGQDAPCRMLADPVACECSREEWVIQRDTDGEFFHTAEDIYTGNTVRHAMKQVNATHCAIKTIVEDDLMDLGTDSFEIIGRTPIDVEWVGSRICTWRRS